MIKSSKLPPLNCEDEWYIKFGVNNHNKIIDQLKKWNERLNDDNYIKILYPYFPHLGQSDKESLRKRTLALMKILILRAHNIVADDFKQFCNRYGDTNSINNY